MSVGVKTLHITVRRGFGSYAVHHRLVYQAEKLLERRLSGKKIAILAHGCVSFLVDWNIAIRRADFESCPPFLLATTSYGLFSKKISALKNFYRTTVSKR